MALAEALETNSSFTKLDFDGNQLGEKGGVALAEAPRTNSSFTELGFDRNQLGEKAGVALAEVLKINFSFMEVNIGGNQLGEEAGAALAEALKTNSRIAAPSSLISVRTSWARRRLRSCGRPGTAAAARLPLSCCFE